jgi:hypothetical protein
MTDLFVHRKYFVDYVSSHENAKNVGQYSFFYKKVLEGRSLPTDVTTRSGSDN